MRVEVERDVYVCVHISESMTSLRAKEVRLTDESAGRKFSTLAETLWRKSTVNLLEISKLQLRYLGTVPN